MTSGHHCNGHIEVGVIGLYDFEQTGGIITAMQVLDFIAQAQGLTLQDTNKRNTNKFQYPRTNTKFTISFK